MKNISNIKVSFTIKKSENWYDNIKNICKKNNVFLTKSGNIIIFKFIFSFCFFEKKNNCLHINATGIKCESDIQYFKNFFRKNILNEELLNFKIDNITSSFSLNKNINLNDLYNSLENVKYNPERFPGLFLKNDSFTAVIFKNGKINILGCKSSKDVYSAWIKILQKISIVFIP